MVSQRSTAVRAGLSVLLGALVALGALSASRATVDAAEIEVTGVIVRESDGHAAIDADTVKYGVVGAIDFSAFLGDSVTLSGGIEDETLYVSKLVLGGVQVTDEEGLLHFTTTDTIEKAGAGYQVTEEGVAFALVGSDELNQVVGETAVVDGYLTGSGEVVLTSLRTETGSEVDIKEPTYDVPTDPNEEAVEGEWGYQD